MPHAPPRHWLRVARPVLPRHPPPSEPRDGSAALFDPRGAGHTHTHRHPGFCVRTGERCARATSLRSSSIDLAVPVRRGRALGGPAFLSGWPVLQAERFLPSSLPSLAGGRPASSKVHHGRAGLSVAWFTLRRFPVRPRSRFSQTQRSDIEPAERFSAGFSAPPSSASRARWRRGFSRPGSPVPRCRNLD